MRRTGSLSPHDAVIEQLRVIEKEVDRVRAAVYTGTIDALEIQGTLLSLRYARGLELD